MRVLQVLTYYRPHTSGLTIYVERLATALAEQGHEVTVLTSRYEPQLPLRQTIDSVRICRVPALLRISKGVVMPTFGFAATTQVRRHDVVHLHLPQLDAAGVALRGRLLGVPSVITYHCDLQLPAGPFNRLVNLVVNAANRLAARLTDRVVTYTHDYAEHSPFLRRCGHKLEVVEPPVVLPAASNDGVSAFARRWDPQGRRPVIGMATRFAAEKGVEVLLDALPVVLERYPEAMVLFAGQYRQVLGEQAYYDRLQPTIDRHRAAGRWSFTGVLSPQEMASFYRTLDLLVVPSLNSTESFGLVQVEAMLSGVPVVAANLPGVRQPVLTSGMGEIAEVGDAASLVRAMLQVLDRPEEYRADPAALAERYAPAATARTYEALYRRLLAEKGRS